MVYYLQFLNIKKPISWIKHQNLRKHHLNKKTSIILDHHIPNNFLFISVFTAIIYVRSHVNIPFHHLQIKISMFHQYLLEKILRVYHPSIHSQVVVRRCEVFIDFLLSTDHLRRYIAEKNFFHYKKSQDIYISKLNFYLLFLILLCPLTFASKLPPTTNLDLILFTDYALTLSFNLTLQKSPWHVGCCIKPNQTMCDNISYSSMATHNIYVSNDTSHGTFLFDDPSPLIDRSRLFYPNNYIGNNDYLNNQTLFCQRYHVFRSLSQTQLAIFTSVIVIIGIIFNSFVFLVLMCGSIRRSTSFTLFVALTCFDLLSLASSLFSLLFRTVMTYLKTSAPFCKMFGIFFLYFRQCSSTTLLLIAVERCSVIKYPFCRHIFEKFRLRMLAFMMLMYAIPIPFDFIFYTSGRLHCEAFDNKHADRYQIFRGFFTVFSYAMIPFVGISISNLLIIIELKNSKKRFITKDDNGTTTAHFTNNSIDKRGTTVMLFVASFAFLLLLGPFYLHWCITYLFYYYPRCHFTRNLYENVQVCMGVSNPYLTVIEKGMRESNHAINFLLYMATSKRFRSDFKRIFHRLFIRIFGSTILFLYRHICFCCTEPTCLTSLEQQLSDVTDLDTGHDYTRKNQAAFKTAHCQTNMERRRQNQLLKATLIKNDSVLTDSNLSPVTSFSGPSIGSPKTVRRLTWNPYDQMTRRKESKRQAERLSRHTSTTSPI